MADQGYIKLFRSIEEWEWIDDQAMFYFWVRLLLMANWEDKRWHGEVVERGSFITSLPKLAAETQLSMRQVRTCLDRLTASHQIDKQATNKWTKITICKYDDYQGFQDDERQADDIQTTGERHSNDIQTTTTKKDKEDNKEKIISKDIIEKKVETNKRFVKPSVEEIRAYCRERRNGIDAEKFFDHYESKGWVVGKSPMKDWKAAVRTWEKMDKHPEAKPEKIISWRDIEK